MESLGVISRVEEPTEWCVGMVVVPKKDKESVRLCVDLTGLNVYVCREHFQRMMAEVIEGLEGVVCHIDDLLVWGRDQKEHDARLHGVLQRLEEAGITLYVDKCEMR